MPKNNYYYYDHEACTFVEVQPKPHKVLLHSAVVLELLASSAAKRDEYLKLAQGVHTRQSLLRSYNIGIEADQRERDMNKRAARLVGLRMPDDGDGDDERGGSNNER